MASIYDSAVIRQGLCGFLLARCEQATPQEEQPHWKLYHVTIAVVGLLHRLQVALVAAAIVSVTVSSTSAQHVDEATPSTDPASIVIRVLKSKGAAIDEVDSYGAHGYRVSIDCAGWGERRSGWTGDEVDLQLVSVIPQVVELSLACPVRFVQHLRFLETMQSLRVLELAHPSLLDETSVSFLPKSDALCELCICVHLPPNAREYLAGLKGLRVLRLLGTGIDDRLLEEIVVLSELHEFITYGSDITDRGLDYCGKWQKVETLILRRARVGDSSVAVLSKLSNLRYLDIQGTAFTRQGVDTIRRSLPACVVSWDEEPIDRESLEPPVPPHLRF